MKKSLKILIFGLIFSLLVFFSVFYIIYNEKMAGLELKSSAFRDKEFIPSRYTCDGEDINPLLEIKNPPPGTKSFVLIMDDPDATGGVTWDHWLLFNIPPDTQYIVEGTVPPGALQGKNSWGRSNYGGPCPPRGSKPHRYMFKLYALDTLLDLPEGTTKEEIEKAMTGHILEQTTLIGLYARK